MDKNKNCYNGSALFFRILAPKFLKDDLGYTKKKKLNRPSVRQIINFSLIALQLKRNLVVYLTAPQALCAEHSVGNRLCCRMLRPFSCCPAAFSVKW